MARRRFLMLALSVLMIAGLGAVAAWTQVSAAATVARVHQQDRVRQQATLAGLTSEYLQLTELATDDAATSAQFALKRDSRADQTRLRHFAVSSPLTAYGAALTTLTGQTLTSYTSSGPLPPATDPGFTPLRNALLAGKPGVSSVMTVHGVPLVAIAVPVYQGGTIPAGLLIAFADVARWPLEGYTASIHLGTGARTYVLDSTGTVVAATDSGLLGHHLEGLPAVATGSSGGFTSYHAGGKAMVVAYAPSGPAWHTLSVQPESGFSGALTFQHERQTIVLILLLTLMVLLLWLFHHKRQQALSRLAEERLFDPLTGLAQRRLLDIRLEAAVARQRRHASELVVLYCDLDGFKSINDRFSHHAGDEMLTTVAHRLRDALRADDFVARVGGDEFVVVLESERQGELDAFLHRVRREVGQPVTLGDQVLTPRVSIGAVVLTDAADVPDLVHEADLAMYRAKRSGSGQYVVVFSESCAAPGMASTVGAPRTSDLDLPPTMSPLL